MLPLSQSIDSLSAGRVARQQESAQSLDGQDSALPEQVGGGTDDIATGNAFARAVNQVQAGAAHGAGVGLGMKTAVQRVIIFPLAIGTHPELPHGGPGPIVGYVFDDGEAGPAVGAVGEGVAIAPVLRREDLFPAWEAGGNVRRDQLVFPLLSKAPADLKALVAPDGDRRGSDRLDPGHRRSLGRECELETLNSLCRPLHFDLHAA